MSTARIPDGTPKPGPDMVISLGWAWRCLMCGQIDATWQDREMCESAAVKHQAECEIAVQTADAAPQDQL